MPAAAVALIVGVVVAVVVGRESDRWAGSTRPLSSPPLQDRVKGKLYEKGHHV